MTTAAAAPRLIPDLVTHAAAAHPDRSAVIGPDGAALTFARFDRMVRSVAAWVADQDGWLATGDIGRIGADGLLYVLDRRKDIVVTGGENVSSREVEDVLGSHPDVGMAAVVGVPDDYWGEAICAVVVPAAGRRPAAEELVAHVRSRLSAFKRPRHVLFVDELPLTTNGKVAKDEVRRHAQRAIAP